MNYNTYNNYNDTFFINHGIIVIDYENKNTTIENFSSTLVVNHSHGFFSCTSVRLYKIIDYMNDNNMLPEIVDSSQQYQLYKPDRTKDITFDFFKHYNEVTVPIVYEKKIYITELNFQFDNYKQVDYKSILPFVTKYFSPSDSIIATYHKLLNKYNIIPDNCIALYYRGTDKKSETRLDSFESYYHKLNEIIAKNNDTIQIIIQSDSAPFVDYIKSKCNKNIILIAENNTSYDTNGIHYTRTVEENYIDIQYLFATFLIIAKCKYIITSSSNGAIWIMYYRNGNTENVYQSFNHQWL